MQCPLVTWTAGAAGCGLQQSSSSEGQQQPAQPSDCGSRACLAWRSPVLVCLLTTTLTTDLMGMVFDTALAIKERIYGNRIVLFAPLYLVRGGVFCMHSASHAAAAACSK